MTTLISYENEKRQVELLANFLEKLGVENITEKCFVILKSTDKRQKEREVNVLKELLDSQHLLWTKSSERDIESFYYIICLLLKKLSEEAITLLLPSILDNIVRDKTDRSALRISLLKGIYNCYAETIHNVQLYKTVLQYAYETGQVYLVLPELDNIERVINAWGCPNEEKIEFYLLAINMISKNDPLKTMNFIIGLLSSMEKDFDKYSIIIKENLLYLIKNENIFYYGSLVDIPAIQSLEKECNPLHNLFKLLISGDYNQFAEFCKNNQFLQSEGVDVTKLLIKFRIIRLSELANTKDILTYDEIANSLSIQHDDVETWVIRTISKKLISCKLDQFESRVIIRKAVPRTFNKENWISLNRKVENWKNNLSGLLQALSKTE